ncbi:T9SS type A sorting domain-containing protein [Psychroserpens sp.]|uniref:T9SS type A sorting domain-containing protein n=1 Tax=Psychroserpens sp. TaxID=2020870 RepID=UPI002B279645|nr:T9SS type A sorting domain-containing protein [Psychroserpens sp.]
MKKFYFTIIFLCLGLLSFSQDEAALFGDWYLHYRTDNGVAIYPPLTTQENYNVILNFGLLPPTADEPFTVESFGPITNTFEGKFNVENGSMEFINIIEATNNCENPPEVCSYFSDYNNTILFDSNTSVVLDEFIVSYEITGTDDDTALIITNDYSGDYAVYGRTAQPTDILGQWYLNHIEVDGVVHPNYYNNESLFELVITEDIGNEPFLDFIGSGACNSYGGHMTPDENDITFNSLDFTLDDCALTPGVIFENIYFSILNSGQPQPFDFPYMIGGENDNQILTITNSMTGDKAIYGRNENTEILTKNWYLSRIEIPGNPTIEIPITESPSLTLTNDINPITFRNRASGEGECNAFMSDYEVTLNNGNSIQLVDFSPTLGFCESDYESEYFNIIGFPPNNFSEFEIINNGTILNVTDLLGARLVFGDQPLSISENELSSSIIALKNNPVTSVINLTVNQSESEINYKIYSLDGKLIKKAELNSESIYVDDLNSGLYVIRFYNNFNQIQTLKFIKQ